MEEDLLTRIEEGGTEALDDVAACQDSPIADLSACGRYETANQDGSGTDGCDDVYAHPVEDDTTSEGPDPDGEHMNLAGETHEFTIASAELITPNCSLLIPISFLRVFLSGPRAEFAQFIPADKRHSTEEGLPIGMIITAARLIHFTVHGMSTAPSSSSCLVSGWDRTPNIPHCCFLPGSESIP